MSRKPDLSKKNDAGYYQSIYDTSKEYNKNNYDVITVRLPKGTKEVLKAYQQHMHQQEPDNSKYSSVNSMINALLDQELLPHKEKARFFRTKP